MKTGANKGWLAIVVVVLLAVGLTWGICKGQQKTWNYRQNGDEVVCEVVEVVRIGDTDHVTVSYNKPDGSAVKANCIANKDVSVGESLTGYVLPDQPGEVFRPASAFLMYLMFGIVALSWIVAIVITVLIIKSNQFNKQLALEGKYAKGKIFSVQRMDDIYFAKIRFCDDNGVEHVTEVSFGHETPREEREYDLIYLVNAKGKCHAQLKGR